MLKSNLNQCTGFQLLEILLVLAIIAILATFSTPIFTHFTVNAKRIEATHALAKLAIALEHYYIQHDTYSGATLSILNIAHEIANQQYQLQIEQADQLDFLISATPQNRQASHDQACGALTLNALGVKGIRGTDSVQNCW